MAVEPPTPATPPDPPLLAARAAAAEQRVAELQALADNLTERRDRLHRNLAEAQTEFDSSRSTQLQLANQELVLAALHSQAIADEAVAGLVALTRSSQRDPLTGTPNRARMHEHLKQALLRAGSDGSRLAVLFVDIDNFKQVNDQFGHALGDGVLQLVAQRLIATVGDPEAVSRHGGEEFVVLLTGIELAADAAVIAAAILSVIRTPSGLGNPAVQLSASLGIALFPEDGSDPLTLIDCADTAMYRSKRLGPGGFGFSGTGAAHAGPALAGNRPGNRDAYADRLRDVNEQLLISALAAQEQQTQAAQAQQRQARFMAIVAHELRNPLTPILTAAALLGEARMTRPLLARMQAIIEDQVAHMTRLIDDLLDRASASAGKLQISRSMVELGSILDVAICASQPAIQRRQQTLCVQQPMPVVSLQADAGRLIQVFSNLLDNASKYTPAGGSIRLSVQRSEHWIEVQIADNGNGIAAEELPQIFELYVQELKAPQMHGGGLGIGLAVVRELVEAHGGSVTAQSAGHGQGSQFLVTLPLDGVRPEASPPTPPGTV